MILGRSKCYKTFYDALLPVSINGRCSYNLISSNKWSICLLESGQNLHILYYEECFPPPVCVICPNFSIGMPHLGHVNCNASSAFTRRNTILIREIMHSFSYRLVFSFPNQSQKSRSISRTLTLHPWNLEL